MMGPTPLDAWPAAMQRSTAVTKLSATGTLVPRGRVRLPPPSSPRLGRPRRASAAVSTVPSRGPAVAAVAQERGSHRLLPRRSVPPREVSGPGVNARGSIAPEAPSPEKQDTSFRPSPVAPLSPPAHPQPPLDFVGRAPLRVRPSRWDAARNPAVAAAAVATADRGAARRRAGVRALLRRLEGDRHRGTAQERAWAAGELGPPPWSEAAPLARLCPP